MGQETESINWKEVTWNYSAWGTERWNFNKDKTARPKSTKETDDGQNLPPKLTSHSLAEYFQAHRKMWELNVDRNMEWPQSMP